MNPVPESKGSYMATAAVFVLLIFDIASMVHVWG
jgi:hypothetical protein